MCGEKKIIFFGINALHLFPPPSILTAMMNLRMTVNSPTHGRRPTHVMDPTRSLSAELSLLPRLSSLSLPFSPGSRLRPWETPLPMATALSHPLPLPSPRPDPWRQRGGAAAGPPRGGAAPGRQRAGCEPPSTSLSPSSPQARYMVAAGRRGGGPTSGRSSDGAAAGQR